MVLQENEIIYKYFSMSLYQKLPENAAVISIYIYMQPLTSSLWIINTISLFFIIPHKKKKSNGLHSTVTSNALRLHVSFSMKYKVCKVNYQSDNLQENY